VPALRSARSDIGLGIAVTALTIAMLTGCTGTPGPATTTAGRATLAPGEEVTPTAAPEYRPEGTAAQNLQYFTAVVDGIQAGTPWGYSSQSVVDTLTSAGFDPGAIEITDSTTPKGNPAVSIETSVRIGDDCLVATLRAERATTDLVPVLPTGRCLPSTH